MVSIVVIFVGFLCICALFYKVPKAPIDARSAEKADVKLKSAMAEDNEAPKGEEEEKKE